MSEQRRRLTKEERLEVLKKTGFRCAYCGMELGFDSF